MAAPLETVLTIIGGGAGLKALELLSKWIDGRSAASQADAARTDAADEKRAEREHAILDRAVKLYEAQVDASEKRSERYLDAATKTEAVLYEMAEAINRMSDRVSLLDGRPSPQPIRPRSLTPTAVPTPTLVPPATAPATGDFPKGER